MQNPKIFIIIPAYNEEKMIGKVIKDIKRECFKDIVVVDNESTDSILFLNFVYR